MTKPQLTSPAQLDAVIVGAGFAGIYMLHRLRQLGFTAHVFEQGEGAGGTWFWNRYPGARCDVPSMQYSYSFSSELEQEWDWQETQAPQEEIERYANHVVDRFGLRDGITLGARVTSAVWDEAAQRWMVETDGGAQVSARFCVMATGFLSAPLKPDFPGIDTFEGLSLQTGNWPREPVDLSGLRVAQFGTGSSGAQTLPEIAKVAKRVTLFQRSPAYTWPISSRPLEPEERETARRGYPEMRREQRHSRQGIVGFDGGALSQASLPRLLDLDEAGRQAALDLYGFAVTNMFEDVATDIRANEVARGLYAQMVRRVVQDPETAESLTPADYPLGCKRNVMNTGWYEAFNLPHVALVDLRAEPVAEVTRTGIRTARREFEFDAIVYATGFDAVTGALERIDIKGRGGVALRQAWAEGPVNYLGLMTAGFPNLFMVNGPGSPGPITNVIVSIEHHVELIGDLIAALRDKDMATIEPTGDAQAWWVDHVNQGAQGTMATHPSCHSWYLGANVPGKQRQYLPYFPGLEVYIRECEEIVADGYRGFVLAV